jgi:hypothetical protein
MPFADDLRKYTFQSLDKLHNKRGETIEHHPNIPTDEMITAMDKFIDSMDLMDAGEKDEEGYVSQCNINSMLKHYPDIDSPGLTRYTIIILPCIA